MREKAVGKQFAGEGNRPSLDRSAVVQAALELLKRVGLDGLTTRNLAAELGVKSPALYWHFHSKQELLDAMADAMISGAGMGPPRPGETWPEWLERRARSYRASLLAYRDSARIVTEAQQLSPATIQALNDELQAMVELGFDPVQALRTITALTNYVDGFVLQEQSSRQPTATSSGVGSPTSPITPESIAAFLRAGKASPLLVAFAQGGSPYSEESFDYGLHALIDGCAAALGRLKEEDEVTSQ